MAKSKDKAVKVAEAPKGKLVPKEIALKLSPQQCLERGDKHGHLTEQRKKMEETFKATEAEWKKAKAEHKSNLKQLQDQIDKLSLEVKAKAANSTEQVTLVLNHDAGVAEYWFKPEGGEWGIYETRPLEDNERQSHLFEDAAAAVPDTGQSVEE